MKTFSAAAWLMVLPLFLAACRSTPRGEPAPNTSLEDLRARAAQAGALIALPELESSPAAIKTATDRIIAAGGETLDRLGRLTRAQVNFANTVGALDDLNFQINLVANRLNLIKETSPEARLREAATEQVKRLQDWSVGLDYREDVYRAVRAYADSNPTLVGEARRLLEETLRDYRRAGLELPKPQRDEIEALRKKVAALSTDFDSNITAATAPLTFTREQLAGLPDSFFAQPGVKTGDDAYRVQVNVTWQFLAVMENARNPETRRQVKIARYNLAREKNVPLITEILRLKNEIALKLGYASWADYQTETKMAKTAATATKFLQDLKRGLQPKFDAELAEFKKLKAAETGEADPQITIWDWRYYANQLKKSGYSVDAEQLRVYFPYEQTLAGMFRIYEQIFSLQLTPVAGSYARWHPDVKLYAISDQSTGAPLGLFYLDMFPREGKYSHFAQFDLIPGKRLADGRYQRPTVALICNFPSPEPGKPSLLTHADVETLFHEFGHALHSILTRADYARFSGTSVPRDFVEAPSQMLENWVWDKKVLDGFAADYRDPSKKIPEEILAKLKEAKLATVGTTYRRQLAMGLLDLALHGARDPKQPFDPVKLSNDIIADTFLAPPPDTAFIADFGHLTGYDAGYYGYAWADAIAADMATVFEKSRDGYFDAAAGRRLRDEIYAPGNSRDVNESIQKFLGRPQAIGPFLKTLGIGK
jgi:thimet oligopeptidase